jgi:hypothetical protein
VPLQYVVLFRMLLILISATTENTLQSVVLFRMLLILISATTENTLIPSSIVVILFGDDLLTRRRLLRSWFSGHA